MTAIPEECIPGPGKSPTWLAKFSHAASEYTSKKWYQDWLETTTSLCTDLSQLAADNPHQKNIVWRTDNEPLFYYFEPKDDRYNKEVREFLFTHGLRSDHASGSMQFPIQHSSSTFILTWYQPRLAFNAYFESSAPDNGLVLVCDPPGASIGMLPKIMSLVIKAYFFPAVFVQNLSKERLQPLIM